jgi:Tol biopolymer transport system component
LSATRLRELTLDFATGQAVSAPADSIDDLSGLNSAADWSSDGKQIVFVSRRPTSADAGRTCSSRGPLKRDSRERYGSTCLP